MRDDPKDQKTLKVAICVPIYGHAPGLFTHSLANMLVYSLSHATLTYEGEPRALEINPYFVTCSMLTEARHKLVADAQLWGADYLLWLDADHVFPHDTLMRLLSHGLPVVGCNYARRLVPTAPTAAALDGTRLYTTLAKAEAGEVEECAHLGFGVLLWDMRILNALYAQAEQDGDMFLPLFKFDTDASGSGVIGEDVYFFRKLAKSGIRPFVDHKLSWEVGHLHEVIMTNAHAVTHREAFEKKRDEQIRQFDEKADELESVNG